MRHPYPLLWLAVASLIGFFYNLHAVPLFDLDEGAFSEATREMFVRGDFISTYLNGVPRYDKPILIYWLQAASVALLGVNEFAFRLPSALCATLWVWVVYAWISRVRDPETGWYAALFMAASLEISIMGKAATADALLNLLITATMASTHLYLHTRRIHWLYAVYACAGLGFLAKGPIALFIPLATTFIYYALRRDPLGWVRAVFNVRGLLIFAVIALPWYIAQYLKEGDAFIQGFFFKHNLERFQGALEHHGGGPFYYVPVVLFGVLPFTTVLLYLLTRIKALWHDDLQRFLLLWFGVVFVLFSASSTKLPHYVVYGYPPLFILMALHVGALKSRLAMLLPAALFFALLLALPELLQHYLPQITDAFTQQALAGAQDYFGLAYRIYFALALAVVLALMAWRGLELRRALAVCGVLVTVGAAQFIVPIVAEIQQRPIKEAALLAKQQGLQVVMWRVNTPSFSVYSGQIVARRDPRPGEVVLTKAVYLSAFPNVTVLYQKNGIALARLAAAQ